jgi:glycosyltransferase involved in cell wall biosynthesis
MVTNLPLSQVQPSTEVDRRGESSPAVPKGRIHYLCMQATREGQASHAHVHEIIQGLERRGWEVTLFEPSYAKHQRPVGILRKLFESIAPQLRLWWRRPRPDLLYVRDNICLLPSFCWARLRGIPVIVEINGSFTDYTVAYPWMRAILPLIMAAGRACWRMSNAVIGASQELCDGVERQIGKKPTFFIPNGANIHLFHPNAERQETLPAPYVVFFGVFAPWQGIETMLRAVNQPEWPADVNLVMVGSGQEQPKVERAAAENPRVWYLGRKPYRAVPGIIASALGGIVAHTNPRGRTKGGLYPLKVFETLACGVPAIVSDHAGQRELVRDNGCGLVFPQDDAAALARSVAYLRQYPEERAEMGRRGRQTIEKGYSWQHSADTTETVINQVIGR